MPVQAFKQDEFECLNLNIVCPAGLTSQSKVPVMLWIHGFVLLLFNLVLTNGHGTVAVIQARAQNGIMMVVRSFGRAFNLKNPLSSSLSSTSVLRISQLPSHIFVSKSFRIGLLGFAASNIIRDDNKAADEEGCGNYGNSFSTAN